MIFESSYHENNIPMFLFILNLHITLRFGNMIGITEKAFKGKKSKFNLLVHLK